MPPLATAYVRVRADTSGFPGDAERGIKGARLGEKGKREGQKFGKGFSDGVKSSQKGKGGLFGLAGEISGFGAASDVASSKSSLFARALGAVNLATGVAEPALAGLIVAAGGLTAAMAAAGAGMLVFGTVASAVFAKASDAANAATTAQDAYKASVVAANTAYASAMKKAKTPADELAAKTARQTTIQSALNTKVKATAKAYGGLTKPQVQLAKDITRVKDKWDAFIARATPGVAGVLRKSFGLLPIILKDIEPLLPPVEAALKVIIGNLRTALKSDQAKSFVQMLADNIVPTMLHMAAIAGHIAVGVGGIIKAFMPFGTTVLGWLDKGTAEFAKWGTTLTAHTGFQSLISTFRESAPMAATVLKNLAVAIGNIARAMTGIASPGNSKALLQMLMPLTQLLANLSQNQALVRIVLYMLALRSAVNKVKPAVTSLGLAFQGAQKGVGTVQKLRAGFMSATAAGLPMTGMAGTLGGKLRVVWTAVATTGAALLTGAVGWIKNTAAMIAYKVASVATAAASKAMAAAQWLVNIAMNANPIFLIVTALVALGVALYVAWSKSATFRKILIGVWHAIWGVLKSVFNWVRQNWPYLVGALGGPFGIAAVVIIRHWAGVCTFIKSAWHSAINTAKNIIAAGVQAIRNSFAWVVDRIFAFFSAIVHGATRAFGWVPVIGGQLRKASDAFDTFRRNVNNSLRGINGRTVHVGVKMSDYSFNDQGYANFHASGGVIRGPGTGTSDSIYAGRIGRTDHWVSNDEYIVNASAHRKYGTGFLNAVNSKRFAGGGSPGLHIDANTPSRESINTGVLATLLKVVQHAVKYMMVAPSHMMRDALSFVGKVPYVWGGTTPAGWDCSGLSSWIYHKYGYPAPRTSEQQYAWARKSRDVPGALAFFVGAGGPSPGHVGLSLGNGMMVNAAGTRTGTTVDSTAGNIGFGIPPGGFRHFARGGVIREPVIGIGRRSGRGYSFGESGDETVIPGRHAGVTINIARMEVRDRADIDLIAHRLSYSMSAGDAG